MLQGLQKASAHSTNCCTIDNHAQCAKIKKGTKRLTMALERPEFKTNLNDLIRELKNEANADNGSYDHHFRNLPGQIAENNNNPNALLENLYQARNYCQEHHLSSQISRKVNLLVNQLEKIKSAHEEKLDAENKIIKVKLYAVLFHTDPRLSVWQEAVTNGLNNPGWLQKHYFSDDEDSARKSYNSDRDRKLLICFKANQAHLRKFGRHWAFNRSAKITPNDVEYILLRQGSGNFHINESYKLIEKDNNSPAPTKNATG